MRLKFLKAKVHGANNYALESVKKDICSLSDIKIETFSENVIFCIFLLFSLGQQNCSNCLKMLETWLHGMSDTSNKSLEHV